LRERGGKNASVLIHYANAEKDRRNLKIVTSLIKSRGEGGKEKRYCGQPSSKAKGILIGKKLELGDCE